jgi:hypothetical protein
VFILLIDFTHGAYILRMFMEDAYIVINVYRGCLYY